MREGGASTAAETNICGERAAERAAQNALRGQTKRPTDGPPGAVNFQTILLDERFKGAAHAVERLFGGLLIFGADGVVDLELGLGAARADADEAAVFQLVIDGVGLGDVQRLLRAVGETAHGSGVVAHGDDVVDVELFYLSRLERIDEGVHLLHRVQAVELDADVLVQDVLVLGVDVHQAAVDGLTDVGVVAHHFGAQHGRDDRILVAAALGAAQVAATLFKAEDKGLFAARLVLFDLFADELEADGNVDQLDAEVVADGLCHAGGDEAFDDDAVCGELLVLAQAGEDVVEQQDADLVARKRDELALVVFDGDAEAGSVPNTTSAPIFLARAMPIDSVSLYSGLGTSTVEKSGSFLVCSSTTVTLILSFLRMVMTGT